MTQADVLLDESVTVEENSFTKPVAAPTIVDLPVQSKRNTHVTEATVTKQLLKGGMQVASYMFDDIMMATYHRGQSIESFFCRFARLTGNKYLLGLEDFSSALSTLNVEWSGNYAKV